MRRTYVENSIANRRHQASVKLLSNCGRIVVVLKRVVNVCENVGNLWVTMLEYFE